MKSAAAAEADASSAPSEKLPESCKVRRLPRANMYDGPTYAIDIGPERQAHIRFLAVHGCGKRFPVLYGEVGDVGVGFSIGELESVGGKGRALPAPGGPWRVRLATSENEDASSSPSAAAGVSGETADGEQPRRGRVVTLDALDNLTGEEMTQLALFDDDLGEQRLYRRTDVVEGRQQWSAATAAPRWPEKLLARLNSRGGVSGDETVVCVDGRYFVDLIELSAFPTPVLFPHGAWRLSGLGPGLSGDFHTAADAVRGVDAVAALSALAASAKSSGSTTSDGADPEPTGRLTGELPGRGRIQLGGSGGVAGVGRALEAVTHREVKATFPSGPLGLGFAPLDWEWGRGAQVWEVDPGSNAEVAGVRPGMVFTSVGDQDVSTADFADIDMMFDGPRPLTVTFNTYVPGAERLYAVEMAAGEALGALRLQQHLEGEGEQKDEEEGEGDFDGDGDGNTLSAAFFTSLYEEPARIFDSSPAVVWREEPSTLFVGDPGSATVVHHDIIGQIELCHVLSGAKLLAAAPWGASSQELLAKAVEGGGKREGREQDEEKEEEEEEEEGSVLSVPVHRKLYHAEKALLSHPGLSVVHARPGDAVAFSSAATHFATNGEGNGPCAAVFHGVLTPASAHVLASHPTRLDPFTEEERQMEGFDGHLTGRMVLQDLLPTGKQVLKAAAQAEAREESKAKAKSIGKTAKTTTKATVATLPRFTVHERGVGGEAAVRRRFQEAVRRMDAAVKASKTKKKPKKNTALGAAPPPWPGASFISVYGDEEEGNEER